MNSDTSDNPIITVDGNGNRGEDVNGISNVKSIRGSRLSIASSFSSILTSATTSNDKELREATEPISKVNRFKDIFHRRQNVTIGIEERRYKDEIGKQLDEIYGNSSEDGVLRLNWNTIFEVNLFGGKLETSIQQSHESRERNGQVEFSDVLMSWLAHPEYEQGSFIFFPSVVEANHFHPTRLKNLFRDMLGDLRNFEEIIELYSNDKNLRDPKLFDIFGHFLDNCELVNPLGLAMFGNFLLSCYTSSNNNYDNKRILGFFWKAARCSYVISYLQERKYFEEVLASFEGNDSILLHQYLKKNNILALSLSLFSIGEYFQFHNDLRSAIDMWEISSHLTGDLDSCQMTIWGLTDGFGTGNKIKSLNKLGKKSKRNKHNTKRRIAQVYRLRKNEDMGTSWVWKSKYD